MHRRRFIRNLGLAGLASGLSRPGRLFAKSVAPALQTQHGPAVLKGKPDGLNLTPADASVLDFVSKFGNRAIFTGGSVAGKATHGPFRVSHILALVTDTGKYRALVTQFGAFTGNGISTGSSICFNHLQTTFELEALLPDPFQKRLADIQAGIRADGSSMVYGHEALLYDPASKDLSDPHGIFAGKYAMLNRIHAPGSYDELARGSLATTCYNLQPSGLDQADLSGALSRNVGGKIEAQGVTGAFLSNLTLSSQVGAQQNIQALCGTRLVRSAIRLTLGCDSQHVIGNFARLRARFGPLVTDGAILHGMFQTAELHAQSRNQAAQLAIDGGCNLETFLTIQDLLKLRQLKANKAFKVYA